MNSILRSITVVSALCVTLIAGTSCSQKKNYEIQMGTVHTIRSGTVTKITERYATTQKTDGAFTSMANTAASAVAPGILATGATKLAAEAGSLVDGRVEAVRMLFIRVKLDDSDEVREIRQEPSSQLKFHIGQKVVISQNSTPGNVWPD